MAKTARNTALRLLFACALLFGLMPAAAYGEGEETDAAASEQQVAEVQSDESTADAQANPSDSEADISAQTAVAALATGTYNLYWYALIPGKLMDDTTNPDQTWFGLGVSTISGVEDPKNLTTGSDLTATGTISKTGTIKALFPDITYNNKTYKYAEPGSENANKEGYYTLSPARVRVSNGANAGKNSYNPVVNSGTNTYHYDNVIILNEKDVFTVNFEIKDAGEDRWTTLTDYAQRFDKGTSESKVKQPNTADVPKTKTVDGIEYTFDGWYRDEACTDKANFDRTIEQNTVYYAHYVPSTGKLNLSKQVSGSAADIDHHFTFELSCSDLAGETYNVSFNANDDSHDSSVSFGADGKATLQLKHGEDATIEGLPKGATISVRETGLSGNAKTSTTANGETVKGESSNDTSTSAVSATIAKDETATIAFTNTADAQPDTGVAANDLPLAALFALAGAGILALLIQKCLAFRKRGQDAWKE